MNLKTNSDYDSFMVISHTVTFTKTTNVTNCQELLSPELDYQ